MPFEYTSTKLEWTSANSTWTQVNGAGSSRANSAWVQAIASTPADWVIAGIAVGGWSVSIIGADWEIDVGVGGVGVEVVKATAFGFAQDPADSYHHFFFPVPIDSIPAGSRVSFRLRQEGTDASVWNISLGYYTKPIAGLMETYAGAVPIVSTPAAAPPTQLCGAAWANVGYTLVENAPANVYVGGCAIRASTADNEVEVDLATGAPGSEVVFTTLRRQIQSGTNGFCNYIMFPIVYDGITSGTRIAFRSRGTVALNVAIKLLYYPKSTAISNRKSSNKPIIALPAAADGIGPTYATAFGAGAYTQLVASAPDQLQIFGVSMDKDGTDNNAECEVDIGVGGAGVESVIATWRYSNQAALVGAGNQWVLPLPIDSIPNGARVAARVRNSSGTNNPTSRLSVLAYQKLAGSASQTSKVLKTAPQAATGISVVPTAGDWTDGAWVQCVASMASNSLIAGLGIKVGSGSGELGRFEIDIGFGANGAEIVATSLRGFAFRFDFGRFLLPTGLRCDAGTRVSFRMRKGTTATNNNWIVALMYYDAVSFSGPSGRASIPIGVPTVLPANTVFATPVRFKRIEWQSTVATNLKASLDDVNYVVVDSSAGAEIRVKDLSVPFIQADQNIVVTIRAQRF